MIRRFFILISVLILIGDSVRADQAKPNFNDDVSGIFRSRCNGCHNADMKKGGLNLETYSSMMQGGGSGAAVEPGDPSASWLFSVVSHAEEPFMPPNSPKIPDAELDTIKKWIEAGVPEAAGSTGAMPKKPKVDFKLDPSAIGKPSGEPAMPQGLPTEPVIVSDRANPVIAMAASPWAPLIAVGGHKQVLLYHSGTGYLLGVLPFAEGTIHSLKFTRDGDLLLAAGGRGAFQGRVVVWNVKTGERIFEVGKESDVVLAADISADRSLIALGGPSKTLRVYNTADGELVYENKKHTDWVTAVSFSPDGVLLASGDRNGGLVVWESATGREFYDLRGHSSMITDVSWRLDSNYLASASLDTTVKLWDMVNNGNQAKSWGAHGGGVDSVWFLKDGRLVTAGRDRTAKLWNGDGGGIHTFEAFPDLAIRAVSTSDDARVVAGDFSGRLTVFATADAKKLVDLRANPLPVAARLEQARQELTSLEVQAAEAFKGIEPLKQAAAAAAQMLADSQKVLAEAEQAANAANAALPVAEQAVATADATANATRERDVQARASDAQALDALNKATAAVNASAEALRVAVEQAAANPADPTLQGKVAEAEAGRVVAQQAVVSALGKVVDAANASRDTRVALTQAVAAKSASDQSLAAAKATAEQANAKVPTLKAAAEQALAAKGAADQALAAQQPAADAMAARLADLKTYVESMSHEIEARNATSAASAATVNPASPAAN
jgi:Planctomycete cytochrome C/WD domain, G-beta repeat